VTDSCCALFGPDMQRQGSRRQPHPSGRSRLEIQDHLSRPPASAPVSSHSPRPHWRYNHFVCRVSSGAVPSFPLLARLLCPTFTPSFPIVSWFVSCEKVQARETCPEVALSRNTSPNHPLSYLHATTTRRLPRPQPPHLDYRSRETAQNGTERAGEKGRFDPREAHILRRCDHGCAGGQGAYGLRSMRRIIAHVWRPLRLTRATAGLLLDGHQEEQGRTICGVAWVARGGHCRHTPRTRHCRKGHQ
jgi:hypothetical protein